MWCLVRVEDNWWVESGLAADQSYMAVSGVKGTFKCVTIKRHKQVSASGFPRHPLLSNVYVIEITTLRARRA